MRHLTSVPAPEMHIFTSLALCGIIKRIGSVPPTCRLCPRLIRSPAGYCTHWRKYPVVRPHTMMQLLFVGYVLIRASCDIHPQPWMHAKTISRKCRTTLLRQTADKVHAEITLLFVETLMGGPALKKCGGTQ